MLHHLIIQKSTDNKAQGDICLHLTLIIILSNIDKYAIKV